MAKSLMSRKYKAEGRRKQLNHCPWRDAKEVEPNHGEMQGGTLGKDQFGKFLEYRCVECPATVRVYL